MRELGMSWWRLITQSKVEVFIEEKQKASVPHMVLLLALIALLGAIAAPLGNLPLPVGLARSAGITLVIYIVAALALFLAARLFGGTGSLLQHFYVLGVLAMPGTLVFDLLGRVDLKAALLDLTSPLGLVMIILFLLIVFGFLLLFLAIDGIHDLGGRKSVRVIGLVIFVGLAGAMTYIILAGIQNTLVDYSIYIWSQRVELLQLSVDHAEIVLFSMAIAIALGALLGILITLPPHPVHLWHLVLLIPMAAFILLWFGSLGSFGPGVKAWFDEGGAVQSVIARPQAVGIVGLILLPIIYALYAIGENAAETVLYVAGVLLTIPSIALFGMFIPIFGIGFFNAAVALILYAQLPILRNTYTGLKEVPPAVSESARGMGMTEWQTLIKIKMPLAMPVIMAGIRISMVMIIGIAAIATLIGVDVLGRFIFDGMQRISDRMVFAGAVAVSVFAIIVDILLGWGEERLTPAGLRKKAKRNQQAS